ncbi:hypothetical protein FRC06_004683 [Ceratobasidium sp. 370]|nr:hypothetical protein FRC06_004683 [Ceratobasidium sp. 370]
MYLRALPLLVAGALLPNVYAATRNVTLTLTYGTTNQDGTTKESWLINGQTPGPHLVWDEGDTIIATVINNGHEPMTMHWHGIQQIGTPWSDGVPGLTQWPIPVGGNFVYNFTLHETGLQWYHSHYKMQLDDGLKGTIFIRPNANKPKPFNQISNDTAVLTKLKNAELNANLLNVYDYKHYTSEHWMAEWERTDVEQLCIDNIITSGKGQVMCPNMTLINSLATPDQKPLTKKGCMYPNNTKMFPYPESKPDTVSPEMWFNCTNSSTPFQVFTVKQSDGWTAFNLLNSGALWDLRVSIDSHKMYYFAADGHYTNIKVATSILIPIGERYQFFVKLDQPGKADLTLNLDVTRTDEFGWVLNSNKWHELPDNTTPLLFNPNAIDTLDPKVYMSYANGTLVDVIFTVTAGNPAMHPPHPMHKHGIKAWLLGSGTGAFPYATVQAAVDAGFKGINVKNPPYRDDFVTPVDITGKAWTVMRFRAVDPGPIVMHCHIDAHLATGMVVVLLEGREKLVPGYVPTYYLNQNKP